MSERGVTPEAAFERLFADLLNEYAAGADIAFEPGDVATRAVLTVPSHYPRSWRSGWALLILGLLALVAAGALVTGTLPTPRRTHFAPDEVVVTSLADPTGNTRILAVSTLTGERRPIAAQGVVLAVSPDRGRLVTAGANGSLTVTTAEGRETLQVIYPAERVTWSPDGKRLLMTNVQQRGQLPAPTGYAIWDLETTAVTPLPFTPFVSSLNGPAFASWIREQLRDPSWAPDSRTVLLPTTDGLIVADVGGTLLRRLPGTTQDSAGYWSPAGDRILVETRAMGRLHVLAVDAEYATQPLEGLSVGSPRFPAWSPDGSQVAFITDQGIVVAQQHDLAAPRLLFSDGVDDRSYPRWSPDGSQIAFLAWAQSGQERYRGLYVIGVDGGEARLLLKPFPGAGPDGYAW